jgi:diadenosine tetraphosphate (Ap4A) HIT family hydrolase
MAKNGTNPYFIKEFEHSIFVIGDHQFYKGYSLILLKDHHEELHLLDKTIQNELFAEVMAAGQAVVDAFNPKKMNYSCYGNEVRHVHWHIFPRYEDDPYPEKPPFRAADQFSTAKIVEAEQNQRISSLRLALEG